MAPDTTASFGYAIADVAQIFIATFAGREDGYNRWVGRQYIAVHEPLDAQVIVAAWSARPRQTVGAYFLTRENTSHVAALDFDRLDGWDLACRTGTVMRAAGVPAYVERSREGRAHLWATSELRLPGIVLRRAVRVWMADAGVLPTEADLHAANIELRPATDRLSDPDSLGHALRLPGMPHPLTGERHPLADPRTGQPIGKTIAEMLLAYELTSTERFIEAAERYRPPVIEATAPLSRTSSAGAASPISIFNASVGCSEVLRREWGVANAAPGKSGPCPLHPDPRNRYLTVAHDDQRVWCNSGGCPLSADGRGHDAYSLWGLAKERRP
jgi:hypothetical protein